MQWALISAVLLWMQVVLWESREGTGRDVDQSPLKISMLASIVSLDYTYSPM